MMHIPKSLRRTSLLLGAALVAACLAACGRVTTTSHGPAPGPAPETYVEIEPNDSPALADFVTIVDGDSYLVVDGHVEAIGFDVVDHIEFEASEPVEIDFFLEGFGPGADVDVTIYDPLDDVVLATYAAGGATESGTIVVHEPGRPFQFVIEAFVEDAGWSLELRAFPHACGCGAATLDDDGAAPEVAPLEALPAA
jgi:hypothetical protein